MNINVTIHLAPETLAVISALTKVFSGPQISANMSVDDVKLVDQIEKQEISLNGKQPKPKAKPAKGKEDVETEEVTLEMCQDLTRKKTQAGLIKQVKAVLTELGVGRVTELAEDQLADYHAKISKL
jgi:hypothetical protein